MPKDMVDFLCIVGAAFLGSMTRVFQKLTPEEVKAKGLWGMVFIFIASTVTAMFCSIMAHALGRTMNFDFYAGIILGGVAGYAGERFLEILEKRTLGGIDKNAGN